MPVDLVCLLNVSLFIEHGLVVAVPAGVKATLDDCLVSSGYFWFHVLAPGVGTSDEAPRVIVCTLLEFVGSNAVHFLIILFNFKNIKE